MPTRTQALHARVQGLPPTDQASKRERERDSPVVSTVLSFYAPPTRPNNRGGEPSAPVVLSESESERV